MSSRASCCAFARALAVSLLAVLACSGGSDPVEPPPTPGSLVATAGTTTQTAPVAGAVAQTPAVRVLSTAGRPMAGVGVTFAVTGGGGSVASATARTDVEGVASAGAWTLGTAAGANELTATVGSLPPVRFTAMGQAAAAAAIHVVSGADQRASVGTVLPAPVVVRIVDAHGNLVTGAAVEFRVVKGGGSVANVLVTTGADGLASTGSWTLGPEAGVQTVLVTSGELRSVPVDASTEAGEPAVIELTGGGQSAVVGTRVPIAPTALVRDTFGNPLPGVTVRFSHSRGWGESGTDATGRAVMGGWQLGTTAGTQTLDATVVGTGVTGRIIATALPGPGATLQLVSGDMQSGTAGEPLAQPIVVRVKDAYGNHVGAAGVTFTITVGGGSAQPAEAVTAGNGEAQTMWTLGPTSGFQGMQAQLVGTSASWVINATAAPPVLLATALDAQSGAACVLKADDSLSCWGINGDGQLGDGTFQAAGTAVPVLAPSLSFRQVAVGLRFACALTTAGIPYCWGTNLRGELGSGSTGGRLNIPTPVAGGHSFASIVTGGGHSCGLTSDGHAWCWGTNGSREIQPTAQTIFDVPARVDLARFTGLTVGGNHTCGISTDGPTYCWGRETSGQLGNGDVAAGTGPHQVAGGLQFRRLTAGADFTCGLVMDGTAYCWGLNDYGQLGDGSTTTRLVPTPVATDLRFDHLEANGSTTCGVAAGAAYCWGGDLNGQLGTGTTSTGATAAPQQVGTPAGVTWRTLHPDVQTCGITTAGHVYCWGASFAGSLGDGVTGSSTTPVLVRGR